MPPIGSAAFVAYIDNWFATYPPPFAPPISPEGWSAWAAAKRSESDPAALHDPISSNPCEATRPHHPQGNIE